MREWDAREKWEPPVPWHDAYLYRFYKDSYLLVVNASNREKDWHHFKEQAAAFTHLVLEDKTFDTGMLSLQGPLSKEIMTNEGE